MRHALASLAVTLVATALTPACWSAEPMPPEVAKDLDVISFPNSIRPQSIPGARTFAQYGFTQVAPTEGEAGSVDVYPPDHAWLFKITVLGSEGDNVTVCVLDEALNGGTYLTQTPLELQRRGDGLLHATDRDVNDPRCSQSER